MFEENPLKDASKFPPVTNPEIQPKFIYSSLHGVVKAM